ncbi:dihydrodipicolinate synthase family protein [Paenibacillus sp. KQZ6P-2]|uniref:Dihydrodipicolinate synthase family protein n=1 Tax=Paenibacillus mangrovi TaxID=2931978 RepID=A0A9X1WLL8_9BACL|nr:dihydrodipicolinate synthase family protein [Paenibacillus mangrovi]MCJ8011572.1 dihydrodipicolinate synthase family protein [Paenibacillus mangrovi]
MLKNGVWPTMITPFTETKEIDYEALEQLIEWYIAKGVDGLFAVCQSSEMFYLSLDERVQLARFVVERAAGRVQVIASGHISDSLQDQVKEIGAISAAGIDAFVIVSNRLAGREESDDVWKRHTEQLLRQIPETSFGIYECPHPYKRLLTPELLRWCADTERFLFLKDTCCDPDQLTAKLNAVQGTQLKLFNANAATLLMSLQAGASGYSGVMANFHPDLYVKLIQLQRNHADEAVRLQQFLGLASVIERQSYPLNAKYHLGLEGLPIGLHGRSGGNAGLSASMKLEIEQLRGMEQQIREMFNPIHFKVGGSIE